MQKDNVSQLLDGYGLPHGSGFTYLCDAVELYGTGVSISEIYREIALRYCKTPCAIAKAVSLCVNAAVGDVEIKPKALIAQVKERIMYDSCE